MSNQIKCAHCDDVATRYKSRQWFCAKHYRFGQMRYDAKRKGKTVPSREQLDALVDPENRCGDCRVSMVWLAIEDQVRVVNLQHYRDGSYGFVCRPCNTRHAFMPGDSFRDLPAEHKYCPNCKCTKPFSAFSKDNSRNGQTKLKSWCKQCADVHLTAWVSANRDHYNATRRARTAARRAGLSKGEQQ